MTSMYHSPVSLELASVDCLIPTGEAVTISIIDSAWEPFGIRAMIDAFQEVLRGTPMQDPSGGVEPTNSG